ncbi:MAG: hypothetical protein K9N51_13885, partial [Candidatus Pacebacteria bacterium]|nr:hypothetical protein [Candidatus Paceibacterota bacterium]
PSASPVQDDRSTAAAQIRLLAPVCETTWCRPMYLAVLRAEPNGLFLVAPYSPLTTAATSGELETGRDVIGLSALCLWNACLLPEVLLNAISWFVDDMSHAEAHDGLRLWNSLAGEKPPPDDLRPRIGPPVIHPDDPRHAYRISEQLRMEAVRAMGSAKDAAEETLCFVPWQDQLFGLKLRMAAEDEALYAAEVRWNVEELACVVRLTQQSVCSPCRLSVETMGGLLSSRMDGCLVVCRLKATVIANAAAELAPDTLLSGMRLLSPDGHPLALERF